MCCGSSRSVGLRPQASILLGDEDGSSPRYMRVLDGSLVPNVSTGAQRYFRGSLVDKAVEEQRLEDATAAARRQQAARANGKVTVFVVTLPDKREIEFTSYATARQYAIRNGGTTRVVQKDPEDG